MDNYKPNDNYKIDRKWGDESYYKSSQINGLLTESKLFGLVNHDLKPASDEDDNVFNIDTHINGEPCQLRSQRINEKKRKDYYPTLRYGRQSGSDTEIGKLNKRYKQIKNGIDIKIPHYLIWGLFDDSHNVIQLVIVDIRLLLEDYYVKYNKNNNYRMKTDTELYEYKDNHDGTEFLIIKGFSVYTYP
tara:strand:+ start:1491 stop:2054 length:564 start_codon:yes stop_codon:yes gene_type:complete